MKSPPNLGAAAGTISFESRSVSASRTFAPELGPVLAIRAMASS
jgi:hypothetical protein